MVRKSQDFVFQNLSMNPVIASLISKVIEVAVPYCLPKWYKKSSPFQLPGSSIAYRNYQLSLTFIDWCLSSKCVFIWAIALCTCESKICLHHLLPLFCKEKPDSSQWAMQFPFRSTGFLLTYKVILFGMLKWWKWLLS